MLTLKELKKIVKVADMEKRIPSVKSLKEHKVVGNKGIFRVAGFVTIRPIHQHFPPSIFLTAQKSLSACTVLCFSVH